MAKIKNETSKRTPTKTARAVGAKSQRAASPSSTKGAKKTPTRRTTSPRSGGNGTRTLHLISDFTGNLANHLVSTVVGQFADVSPKKVVHRFCDSDEKRARALRTVRDPSRDVVLHAVLDPAAKGQIEAHAASAGIPCFDLTGPLTDFLTAALQSTPKNDPDRVHPTDEGYFHRIDAMEFTLQHDDSRRLESIHEADVVLLGISRVSKSPTSSFLGSLGYKAANVSIAPSLGLPKELARCKGRVVALTMQPSKLFEIRQRRFRLNGFATALAERDESLDYLQLRDVSQEVMAAEQLYRKAKIPIVDVTGMTIEEAATHVLEELKLLDRR